MPFKKIYVDKNTFENIAEKLTHKYIKGNGGCPYINMKTALLDEVFNIKKEYVEDEWNDCDVLPPDKYDGDDVLIREKGMAKYENNHTSESPNYILGNFIACEKIFIDSEDGYNVFEIRDPSKYEYKFIK